MVVYKCNQCKVEISSPAMTLKEDIEYGARKRFDFCGNCAEVLLGTWYPYAK